METNGDLSGLEETPQAVVTVAVVEKPPVLLQEQVTSTDLRQSAIEPESSPPRICGAETDGTNNNNNNNSSNGNGPLVIPPVVVEPTAPKPKARPAGENTEEDMPELTVQSELPVQQNDGKEDDGPPEITNSVKGQSNSDLKIETEPKIEDQTASAIVTGESGGTTDDAEVVQDVVVVLDEGEEEEEEKGANLDDSSLNDDSIMQVDDTMESSTPAVASETASTPTVRKERKKRKTRSELDRLLMDEGTVKILMGPSASTAVSPNVSKKDKLKELSRYREEVISQVRDSSRSKLFSKVSLREKSKSRRQQQQERNAKKAKLEPASKIIRRRSSSSNFNFSSRSPSPVHMSPTLQTAADDPVQVRVHDSIGYITIASEAVLFNTQITSRLTTTLNSLKLEKSVTVVQVTTTNDFIQGLDIDAVRSETDDSLRQSMADSMVACLDSLLKTLTNYPKLLVAGVSGDAVDFGVLILSYFDLVYASDKATFQTNYVKNGYLPECLQLFPKNRLTHAMLYTGKKLTATEGVTSGLVTEVLWPAKFQAELASRIRTLGTGNQEVLIRTKSEVAAKNSTKLELTRDLRSSWLGF